MRLPILALCGLAALSALPLRAEVPQVVTDIPPVHALVAQVMGDLGTPSLLLDPGADEHDFQLRPSQMQSLEEAGLIIWIGPDLTPWLARATEGSSVPMLTLLDAAGTIQQDYPDEEGTVLTKSDLDPAAAPAAEDSSARGAAHEEHEEHEGHDHAGRDPHAWLNPDNAVIWLAAIARALSEADPENAATYGDNSKAAQDRIAALDAQIAAMLAPVADQPFMTYHNAYGYFAQHYGVAFVGAVADGEAALPGAAHLTEVQARLSAGGVVCLFPEIQHDSALSDQLLAGTPTRLGPALDPVGSGLVPGPQAHAALLTGLAGALVACLGG